MIKLRARALPLFCTLSFLVLSAACGSEYEEQECDEVGALMCKDSVVYQCENGAWKATTIEDGPCFPEPK
jgi:hypothetical protein